MKPKAVKGLIIALFLLVLGGSAYAVSFKKSQSVSKVLSIMTAEERYYLDAFFRDLLFCEGFAYVLFGCKPMAFTSYGERISFNIKYDCISAYNFKVNKGFEVFKKYQHFFSSRDIVFRVSEFIDWSGIIMINKKNILNVFDNCKDDFEKVLGSNFTRGNFLSQLLEKDNPGKMIKYHEALLGILLGYGKNNAWLFHHISIIRRKLKKIDSYIKRRDLLEKEFAEMSLQLTAFSTDPPRRPVLKKHSIPLPGFGADPNSLETKELKEKYGKDRERMIEIFTKQGFLEAVLQQLMSE